MKRIIAIVVFLVLVLLLVGFLMPRTTTEVRSAVIHAPVATVFKLTNDLDNWPKWSPWFREDPDLSFEFGDKTKGKGASYTWESNKMGEGKLWI